MVARVRGRHARTRRSSGPIERARHRPIAVWPRLVRRDELSVVRVVGVFVIRLDAVRIEQAHIDDPARRVIRHLFARPVRPERADPTTMNVVCRGRRHPDRVRRPGSRGSTTRKVAACMISAVKVFRLPSANFLRRNGRWTAIRQQALPVSTIDVFVHLRERS